jgi:hypothetical protein
LPKKMDLRTLKAILAAEKADALAAYTAAKLSEERADAMDYFLGDMSKDMPAADGRSSAVSSDVADTIEGLMPSLMDIMCGSDEVVKFEPVGPEDVQAAEQETDYTNHVFLQENPGFMVMYGFIKDALLQKVGVVKVWWDESEQEERETYFGKSEDEFALIAQGAVAGDYEIAEHTPNEDGTHDVTLLRTKAMQQAKVLGVPPEEFGIERGARDIKTCNYCFHSPPSTVGELIAQGFDEDQVKTLISDNSAGSEEISRDTVDEHNPAGDSLNELARPVRVTEHYIRLDYEGDGKPCIYKITTAGEGGEILRKDGKEDIERVDVFPFAAVTPVPIPHRFFGRSIADLVMDIQRIKTALVRGKLDNIYLHNNPRVEVAEANAGPNTLDDLLVSRPGGIVRTKIPGGLQWQVVPDITGTIYPALEYWDATREWRTGVTRQGQGLDADALQNQTATAAQQGFNAAQARMKLIARIIAETGVRDMFSLLHQTIRKHGTQAKTVRLRNTWVTVDPRTWKTRNDMTITVGLGNGGKTERASQLMMLLNVQKEAIVGGLPIVTPKNVFNTVKELGKVIDLKDITPYMTDPQSEEGQAMAQAAAQKPDPKILELQMKNEIEKTQAMADIETNQQKLSAEMARDERKFAFESSLEERRFELEKELKLLDAQIKLKTSEQDMEMKRQTAETDLQFKAADHQLRSQERAEKAKEAKQPKASIEVKHGADELTGPLSEVIKEMGEVIQKNSAAQGEALVTALKEISRPKKARKGKDGTWQVEPA